VLLVEGVKGRQPIGDQHSLEVLAERGQDDIAAAAARHHIDGD
jgi:hypothetical protein